MLKHNNDSQKGVAVPLLVILVGLITLGVVGIYYKQDKLAESPGDSVAVDQAGEESDEVIYFEDATVIPPAEDEAMEETAEGNLNPRIQLLTGYLNPNYSNEDTVDVRFESSDPDGDIARVVVYAGSRVLGEIANRGITEGEEITVLGKSMDKAVETAADYVEDERDDVDVNAYSFRGTGDWSADAYTCDITNGYMVVVHSDEMFYDVRMSEDFDDVDICYEGSNIGYQDKYFLKWDEPEAGEYSIYGVAHDDQGATKRSKSFDIDVSK